jgi:hypothetical protein
VACGWWRGDGKKPLFPEESGRYVSEIVVSLMNGNPELLHVVGALHAIGRIANLLDRGQKQTDQNGNDGDDNEQFNEREPLAPPDYREFSSLN